MDNIPFDNENNSNPDEGDFLHKEAAEIQKKVKKIFQKLMEDESVAVENIDILQYLRAINFNFVSLSKLMYAMYSQYGIIETRIEEMHIKLDNFLETQELVDAALSDKNKDENFSDSP